jgi:hypothetical protein
MTALTRRARLHWMVPALAALIAACGGDGDGHRRRVRRPHGDGRAAATARRPPRRRLKGLVVIDTSVPAARATAPPNRTPGTNTRTAVLRSLPGVRRLEVAERPENHGTGADGQFAFGDLPPGPLRSSSPHARRQPRQ